VNVVETWATTQVELDLSNIPMLELEELEDLLPRVLWKNICLHPSWKQLLAVVNNYHYEYSGLVTTD